MGSSLPNRLNEFNHAEDPARQLLERLGVDPGSWRHTQGRS